MNIWEENIDDWDGDQYDGFFGKKPENLDDFSEFEDENVLDIEDIDFSDLKGKTTKDKMKQISKKTSYAKVVPKKKRLDKSVSKSKKIVAQKNVQYQFKKNKGKNVTSSIILPNNQEVLIKGVNEFILGKNNAPQKNIGYYKGEKLKELVLIINNDTPNDFTIEFFNPSAPLDYLYATTDNLNNKIKVAGDNKVAYSDLLFNVLANPIFIPNAKFTLAGLRKVEQYNQPMIFKNKNLEGKEKIFPIQNALNIDITQQQDNIVYWDINKTLGRLFAPDGMDIMEYTILSGMYVVFAFYYKQISLNKVFIPDIRNKGIL
jgi:hypothetical protein